MDPVHPIDERLRRELLRLHGHMAALAQRATERALRLHADTVSVEHLVGAVMEDEDCAAFHIVEHAFADPETLAQELLALSTGIMVVGSGAALPFSPRAVDALRAAHAAAAATGGGQVEVATILRHAAEHLSAAGSAGLSGAGFDPGRLEPNPARAGGTGGAGPEGSPEDSAGGSEGATGFFGRFSSAAKRALSQANRRSALAGETSISPARLVLACLEADSDLEASAGLTYPRARQALAGQTVDASEVPWRAVPPDGALLEFLAKLPAGSGSLGLLAACHGPQGTPELAELLRRHMVTPALIERSGEAFGDPAS